MNRITKTQPLEGKLAPNNKLASSEKLVQGKVIGPEHILFHNGEIYTGVLGQGVVKVVGDKVEPVVNFGKPCKLPEEEPICGRVLGVVSDTKDSNSLLIADAYHGIFHYNLDTKKSEKLVGPDTQLEGKGGPRTSKVFNSIAAASNGDFYWSSTSSDYTFEDGIYAFLANPSGRLFHYDRKTGQNRLLADGLNFANGVALSPNEDFVIVAETNQGRVLKVHLKGPKAGQVETFLDGIPGGPDNVEGDRDGVWIAVPLAYDEEHPFISHLLAQNPKARQFFTDMLKTTESPHGLLKPEFPEDVKKTISSYIGSFGQLGFALAPRTTMLRLDWDGNIVQALHATDGSVAALSHAVQKDGYLYMGSPFNNFIAKYKL